MMISAGENPPAGFEPDPAGSLEKTGEENSGAARGFHINSRFRWRNGPSPP